MVIQYQGVTLENMHTTKIIQSEHDIYVWCVCVFVCVKTMKTRGHEFERGYNMRGLGERKEKGKLFNFIII